MSDCLYKAILFDLLDRVIFLYYRMSVDKKLKKTNSPIYSQHIAVDENSEEDNFEKTNQIFIMNSQIN
jgi:hypothetical protein